jgi:hypothetical protein
MPKTQTAEPKTIDLDAIQAVANEAGMTASELLEWGMYAILETWDGENGDPRDAAADLKSLQKREGMIPVQLIPSNPLADFAAEAGISFSELSELALLATFDILKSSEFPDAQPRDILENYRREKGPLMPHFQHDRVKVHPFMAALFSGDLKAIHGETFGDYGSDDVRPEHVFIRQSLKSAFELKYWDDTICQLMAIEPAIRHCPTLQNEAAAIRALIQAEDVLSDFCQAVDNT